MCQKRLLIYFSLPAHSIQTAISAWILTDKAWQSTLNRAGLNYFKRPQDCSYPPCSSAAWMLLKTVTLVWLEQTHMYPRLQQGQHHQHGVDQSITPSKDITSSAMRGGIWQLASGIVSSEMLQFKPDLGKFGVFGVLPFKDLIGYPCNRN